MLVLDLGSGAFPHERAGARVIHLDRTEGPCVELVTDLNNGIPLPSNVVDEIVAIDVVEHLIDVVAIMDEMHRVLVPDGLATISVPLAGSYNHVTDPTHVRGFSVDSFDFWDDSTKLGAENGRGFSRRRWRIESKDTGVTGMNIKTTMRALKPGESRREWKP